MTSDAREVRLAEISDVHLGHTRTKTPFIINNLNKHLVTDAFLASIDVLFIAGDLYDSLLTTYSDEYQQIGSWGARLLRKCHRYGVAIRIMEGTISHDRHQGVQLVTINEAFKKIGKGVEDLRYIDNLELEYMAKWGIWVLYVPDDLPGTPQDTLDRTDQLMRNAGITKVDLAIMHGQFPHQLPDLTAGQVPMHDDIEYAKRARLIFIGHVHHMSVNGNIHASGSFDRLSHGYEEPKGFFRAVLGVDGYSVTFIENTGAAVYKTVTCNEDSVTDNIIKIGEAIKNVPNGSNLRIEAKKGNPILDNMALIKERWPFYIWTNSIRDKEKVKARPILDHKQHYVPVMLDRDTLQPTLLARLAQRSYAPDLQERCAAQLSQITGGT